jgi:hypothetical protein
MNYVNRGRRDYDALVVWEEAVMELPQREVRLPWWWFVGAQDKPEDEAHPVIVPGAGVRSHETQFAPRLATCPDAGGCSEGVAYRNYVGWLEFLRIASDKAALPHVDIVFEAKLRERRERAVAMKCRVVFNDPGRERMRAERESIEAEVARGTPLRKVEKRYFSFPCVS